MKLAHTGMGINESDWSTFLGHAAAAMDKSSIPKREWGEIAAYVQSIKAEIVE